MQTDVKLDATFIQQTLVRKTFCRRWLPSGSKRWLDSWYLCAWLLIMKTHGQCRSDTQPELYTDSHLLTRELYWASLAHSITRLESCSTASIRITAQYHVYLIVTKWSWEKSNKLLYLDTHYCRVFLCLSIPSELSSKCFSHHHNLRIGLKQQIRLKQQSVHSDPSLK